MNVFNNMMGAVDGLRQQTPDMMGAANLANGNRTPAPVPAADREMDDLARSRGFNSYREMRDFYMAQRRENAPVQQQPQPQQPQPQPKPKQENMFNTLARIVTTAMGGGF